VAWESTLKGSGFYVDVIEFAPAISDKPHSWIGKKTENFAAGVGFKVLQLVK